MSAYEYDVKEIASSDGFAAFKKALKDVTNPEEKKQIDDNLPAYLKWEEKCLSDDKDFEAHYNGAKTLISFHNAPGNAFALENGFSSVKMCVALMDRAMLISDRGEDLYTTWNPIIKLYCEITFMKCLTLLVPHEQSHERWGASLEILLQLYGKETDEEKKAEVELAVGATALLPELYSRLWKVEKKTDVKFKLPTTPAYFMQWLATLNK